MHARPEGEQEREYPSATAGAYVPAGIPKRLASGNTSEKAPVHPATGVAHAR